MGNCYAIRQLEDEDFDLKLLNIPNNVFDENK